VEPARFAGVLLLEFMVIFLSVSFAAHLLVATMTTARLRQVLAQRPRRSLALALLFGVITPFCSCSTVPFVAGMVAAGVPIAATTAFLVISPLVNPATVALLATLVSPLHAAGFVVVSMLLALAVAFVVVLMRVEVRPAIALTASPVVTTPAPWRPRLRSAAARSVSDLRRLLPLLAAVAILGAWLGSQIDLSTVGRTIQAAGPWAVPVAVLVGVPVYASTALLLPLGAALLAGGTSLGVVTAFMIGATGLSLPEGVMLQRLLGGRYLAVLAGAFIVAAVAIGYLVEAFVSIALP
jgi:uncharacterized protein